MASNSTQAAIKDVYTAVGLDTQNQTRNLKDELQKAMRTQLNDGAQTPGMQHMIILHSPRHRKDATEPPAILTQRESKGLANHHELKQFIEAAKAQNE